MLVFFCLIKLLLVERFRFLSLKRDKFIIMGLLKLKVGFGEWYLLILLINLCLMVDLGSSNVVLMGNNLTLSFDDVEANFGE